LDMDVNPEGFVAWRERTLGYLAADRPDVRKLLLWAERQPGVIKEGDEQRGAVETGMTENIEHVNYILYEAIKAIMTDALLSRARACGDGRGLELWRRLHAEWRGNAPQVIAAKARRFQDSSRSAKLQKLWEVLPAWEQFCSEVAMGGYPVPDWVKSQALDKLVPHHRAAGVDGLCRQVGLGQGPDGAHEGCHAGYIRCRPTSWRRRGERHGHWRAGERELQGSCFV
jgi:hypothetical protein